jgi:rubredoxin
MSNDHPAAAAPEQPAAAAADPNDSPTGSDPSSIAVDQAAGAIAAGDPEPEAAAESVPPAGLDAGGAAASTAPADDPDQHRFECRSCGFVYDPAEGIRKLDIPAGTPFSALDPVGFRCPVCRSRVGAFRDIGPRDKPSGFEENLNFGLGVNRLTPGQKNVLIFTGFALAIAFFLSLYSLR